VQTRIDQTAFRRVTNMVLLVAGLNLIRRALVGWIILRPGQIYAARAGFWISGQPRSLRMGSVQRSAADRCARWSLLRACRCHARHRVGRGQIWSLWGSMRKRAVKSKKA